MENVMNNPDLRGIIFSFFRDKHYKKCHKCKKTCQWNKETKVCNYISWTNFINCHDCFKKGFVGNQYVFKTVY